MPDRFQNKYRISSARLKTWNYASEAAYFITICTRNRVHYFGEIENHKMKLSNMGVIADIMWYEIKNHAKNIELGEFVVMPNHVHGILILNGYVDGNDTNDTNDSNVETRHALSLQIPIPIPPIQNHQQTQPPIGADRFQNQGKNTVSSIIGGYKSAVTKHANRFEFEFGWQSLFHDHIIRNGQGGRTKRL